MTYIDTNTRGQGHRLPANKRWRIVGSIMAAGALLAGSAVVFQNDDYQDNLQMIRSASVRNTNHDNSAYRDVKQSELVQADHLGPRSNYQERHFPIENGGQFRVNCEFSHFAYDDPILFPDDPGAAHLHMFFGNTDTNAYTTMETLEDSGSGTCNGQELNRSGYWVPAMFDGDGNVRTPERIVIYYKGEGLANGNHPGGTGSGQGGPNGDFPGCCGAVPYERGMRNIAPNPSSVVETSGGGDGGGVNYKCTNNFSPYQFADGINEIPDCDGSYYINNFGASYPTTRTVLEMEIKFWNCFHPNHSPADNQGRAVTDWEAWKPSGPGTGGWFYSNCSDVYGVSSGPEMVHHPSFEYFVNYVVEPGEDTSDWFLSSDVDTGSLSNPGGATRTNPGGAAHHGDVWWSWHPETNQQWIDNCVNFSYINFTTTPEATGCGTGFLSNAGPDNTNPYPGPALKFRPQFDTPGTVIKYPTSQVFAELCAPLNPGRAFTNDESAAFCTP